MAIPLGVGNVLAEAGDLTVRRLSRASTWQKTYGGTIERALLSTGAVTEEVLTAALSQAYGLPGVSRATLASSDPDIVDCLPAKERRRFRAFPFALSGKRLRVATCDPRNLVLLKNLEAATGFEVDLHVTPDPVLEDLIERFEGRAAGAAPDERTAASSSGVSSTSPIVPVPGAPASGPAAPRPVPDDSIDRLGRALLAEALRFGATEFELGTNAHGAFLRTFDADHPAITRRLSAAFLGPLASWFQKCCRRAEGFVIEANGTEGTVSRRIELLAADTHGVRVRLHPFEETANAGAPKAVDVSCRHENAEGFVFCPHCGDVL